MQITKRTGLSEPFQLAKLQRVLDEAARDSRASTWTRPPWMSRSVSTTA